MEEEVDDNTDRPGARKWRLELGKGGRKRINREKWGYKKLGARSQNCGRGKIDKEQRGGCDK